jgi:hypothetical protein
MEEKRALVVRKREGTETVPKRWNSIIGDGERGDQV